MKTIAPKVFQTDYAGHIIRYSLVYPATRYRFHPWLKSSGCSDCDIQADPKRIEKARSQLPEGSPDAYVEFRSLIGLTAKELLKYDCCIFHSVAFIWHEDVFLLTAPSGTGKTTQFLNWIKMFPHEITIICGDMPVLERRNDGSIWAYPTSWNGKENLGTRISGRVKGIVLLEQGNDNTMSSLSARDAIQPFFSQFPVHPCTEHQIRALCRIVDQILRNIPCFRFKNCGDDSSTLLLRETLLNLITD